MDHYHDLFSLKYPLCDPKGIRRLIKSNFEANAELVTVRLSSKRHAHTTRHWASS